MIPHVTNHDECDITDIEEFRKQLNKENEKSGARVSMLAFMIKAAATSLKKFPEFNASLDGDNLILKRYYHIGFAADTPQGLVVPVIRDADKKGVIEIAKEMGDLAKLARDGKLKPDQMQGGTFTISSLGGIGGTYFTPIINAPEVAIMGACRSFQKPVWDGKQFVPRLYAAAVVVVGSSRDRWSSGGTLQCAISEACSPTCGAPSYRGTERWPISSRSRSPTSAISKTCPMIEVLVQPGDPIKTEQSLITLESDKASMDVPSPVDGVVKELRVKVGDKVSEGRSLSSREAETAPAGVTPKEKVTGGGTATGEGAPVADYGAASGVYDVVEVRVPDIGDFKDVPIIEIAVKGGDKVKPEDPLITLESDKASMEVPSPSAGTVKDLKVTVGDKVSAGSLILTLETGVAGRSSSRAFRSPRAGDRAGRGPAGSQTFGRRRRRVRHAGPRRRTGRLFGGVPLRRPRHDNGAGGTLSDARRRLPQCRLHPLEGAATHRRRHGRSQGDGRARHRLFRAADRPCQAARSQGEGGRQIDRRPGWHG